MAFKVLGSTGERSFSFNRIRSKGAALDCAAEMARVWWVVRVIGPKGVLVAKFRDGERVEGEG